ncbi:class I SAM-dependent methyltransferase [Natrialba swarupiae]|uniref:Class I SAM-dependent methyltransferase n=1 Tax=Natrialba swarupiae TaxID=2448032 RepID=A0A5D5AQW8_9EURY|nr:class I SAM-dependent methyltransferase [Natrialba swarupiae]TYT63976.1 class I SAM-dependent methyltransferase [Natrialba swarupiae]
MASRTSNATAEGEPTDSTPDDDHLERSRRMWDRWSDYYRLSERDFEPMREAAIDELGLESGDRVLDVGCGPGVNFERIRHDVGGDGTVVAVDYSPEMVEKARDRIDRHGWDNVEVRRADATTVEFEERFDAAVATLSMSVMPDVREAVENVHRHLGPGAPLAVIDIGPVPEGPARIANPFLRRFLRWYANWNPDGDVPASVAAVFAESELVDRFFLETCYTIIARKADVGGD